MERFVPDDLEVVYRQLPSNFGGLQKQLRRAVEEAETRPPQPEGSKERELLQQSLERLKAYEMLIEGVVLATALRVAPEMFRDILLTTRPPRVEEATQRYLLGLVTLALNSGSDYRSYSQLSQQVHGLLREERRFQIYARKTLHKVLTGGDTLAFEGNVPDYARVLHDEAVRRLREVKPEYVDTLVSGDE